MNCSGDEFPWVQRILFQDSITWIRTNEGLYKIIQRKNETITWSKEIEGAGDIYIDSKNTIWAADFGNGLYINKDGKWSLIQNDTVKYVSNIFEFDSDIFIWASLNNKMTYLKWDNGKWKETTALNRYFMKWQMAKQGVKDLYFDKKRNSWVIFFGFGSDKIEVNNVTIKAPPGELIQHHDVDVNGAPWILTTNGWFFSYNNGQWVKRNRIINPVQSSSLRFWVKSDEEFWVGGYAYVAYFANNQWIELSFLTPQAEHEGPEEADTDVSVSDTKMYKWGVINDNDGYSNLRRSPDGKSEVIAKILSDFQFKYYPDNNADWWLIETERGTKGYLHKSRVQGL